MGQFSHTGADKGFLVCRALTITQRTWYAFEPIFDVDGSGASSFMKFMISIALSGHVARRFDKWVKVGRLYRVQFGLDDKRMRHSDMHSVIELCAKSVQVAYWRIFYVKVPHVLSKPRLFSTLKGGSDGMGYL